jgi:hypothetical protein
MSHGCVPTQVFGIRSAPSIAERLRRQFRHFRWPHGEDAHQHSMLIAGCGSGHQVAQALLSYADCMLIAGCGSGHQVAQALLSYEHVSITAIGMIGTDEPLMSL